MPPPANSPLDHERPETYPVYTATQQVSLDDSAERVLVGLKSTGLDLHFPSGQVLHYDLAGRLLRVAQPNVHWRRGLSGRMLELRRRPGELGGGLQRRVLTSREIESWMDDVAARVRQVAAAYAHCRSEAALPSGRVSTASLAMCEVLAAAAAFDAQAARADVARFQAVYHDIPILPPDQYSSLVLAATDGCRYNKCTFCGFYRGTQFRMKSVEEFEAHMRAALAYHGPGLALRRGIFLGQADALLGPRPWREAILRLVNRACELPPPDADRWVPNWWRGSRTRFTGMASFLDVFAGVRMTAEEFAAMRRLNLRQIYIGMESGADALLRWLRKPATAEHMLHTVRAAKSGGMHVGVIVLVGAGGERFFDEHVQQTVQVIRAMDLGPDDYVYLSPLVAAQGAEYAQLAEAEQVCPLTPARLAEQERLVRQGLQATAGRRGPYVAHYEVENFVY
ncbi:MAG: radical SAM protein [Pirellulaceae bacterium]